MATLPEKFNLRPAAWEDVQAVADLTLAVCTADGDPQDAAQPAELKTEWGTPGFTLGTDAWVVTDLAGRVIGYEEFFNRHAHASLQGDGYVHPEYEGQGVGTALLRALEQRAQAELASAEADLRVFLRNVMTIEDQAGRALHENEGYRAIRYSWSMRINLDDQPPVAQFPAGVEIRPFDEARHLFAVYEAIEEAFADHWSHPKSDFASWKYRQLAPERYHPELWHVAWAGEDVAGVALCRYRGGMGWVGGLGVRRPWRKQGLGMALLLHSFQEFHRRGQRTVGLGVDASNPTGATRLYERAGMYVKNEYVCYEKELRPGRDPEE